MSWSNGVAARDRVRVLAKMTAEEASETLELIQMDAEERMTKAIEVVSSNYNTVRTGRASISLLDRIKVVRIMIFTFVAHTTESIRERERERMTQISTVLGALSHCHFW